MAVIFFSKTRDTEGDPEPDREAVGTDEFLHKGFELVGLAAAVPVHGEGVRRIGSPNRKIPLTADVLQISLRLPFVYETVPPYSSCLGHCGRRRLPDWLP